MAQNKKAEQVGSVESGEIITGKDGTIFKVTVFSDGTVLKEVVKPSMAWLERYFALEAKYVARLEEKRKKRWAEEYEARKNVNDFVFDF